MDLKANITVEVYDAYGNLIPNPYLLWNQTGHVGTILADGSFMASDDPAEGEIMITCTYKGSTHQVAIPVKIVEPAKEEVGYERGYWYLLIEIIAMIMIFVALGLCLYELTRK